MRSPAAILVIAATELAAAEPMALATEGPVSSTSAPDVVDPAGAPPDTRPHPTHIDQSLSEAPSPDQAHGMVREEAPNGTRLIWIPRVLLLVPRAAVWSVTLPIRGGAYVYEKYDLRARFIEATFTDDRRFGIYPVGGYDSNFGASVGARVLYKNILGAGERLKLRADWGGQFKYGVGANLQTGRRFGHVSFGFDSSFEKRPREKFWGIGDGPRIDGMPSTLIDPSVDDTAIKSTFSEDVIRNTADVKIHYAEELRSRVSGAVMLRDIGPGLEDDITMNYDTSKLVGFDTGVKNIYVEHELAYDSRRPSSEYQTHTLDATGWYASVHTGIARGIENDPTRYVRYGGELQRYIDLYDGSRILALRVLFDAVGGTDGRTDGRIAFTDLPRLGGSEYLRGYATERFRDRAVALGTVEYQWAVGINFAAYTFVDVGRPFESLEDAKSTDVFRMGFGGGLQVHTRKTFFTRLQVAASREGDVLFNLIFSPAFGRRERAGKY
jgi:hypothetical protein